VPSTHRGINIIALNIGAEEGRLVDNPMWAIWERVAEVQPLLDDHVAGGKHSAADVVAKAQVVPVGTGIAAPRCSMSATSRRTRRRELVNFDQTRPLYRRTVQSVQAGTEASMSSYMGGVMGVFYEENADTPTKIDNVIGGIFGSCVFVVMAWLMVYPLWHTTRTSPPIAQSPAGRF